MKPSLISVLVAVIMLSGISSVFAQNCGSCKLGSRDIIITCESAVKDSTVGINCTTSGILATRKCYEWKGDLKAGENSIQLTRFTTAEGKRFNPVEYAVNTISLFTEPFAKHPSELVSAV